MEQLVKTLSTGMEDGTIVVKREVTERLTEQDILSRRQQLTFQQADLKNQIKRLNDAYGDFTSKIAECDEMLGQFMPPQLTEG